MWSRLSRARVVSEGRIAAKSNGSTTGNVTTMQLRCGNTRSRTRVGKYWYLVVMNCMSQYSVATQHISHT